LRIALDFDDTFTRDPQLWKIFIMEAQQRAYDIRIVTFRGNGGPYHYNGDLEKALAGLDIPVIYTGGLRKRTYCSSINFYPDVWIDDMPELIVPEGDSYIPGEFLARQQGYGNK
jgi:hypothetical protein